MAAVRLGSNVGMSQMSQVSWLNAQKQQQDLQRQMDPNYSRMRPPPSNLPPGTPQIDTDQSSEEASIHDFESPQMMASTPAHPSHQYPVATHHRQYQVHPSPQTYYDGSQHIDDPSQQQTPAIPQQLPQSDMSHPGF